MGRVMRGAALARYAEVASELGLDPRAMLRQVGIDRRILTEADFRYPAEKGFELLERSAQASGCETFGLLMAERRRLSDYGPVSLLLAHQPSLRDALTALMRYQRMLNEALVIHTEEREGTVIIREELAGGGGAPMRQAYELAIGTMFSIFSGPIGPRLVAQSVHFTHAAPKDLALHRRLFGPVVEFGASFNGFVCRRADFDAPSPTADPTLLQHAEGFLKTLPYAEEVTFAGEVQKAIHVLLPFNGASMTAVCQRLGVAERTLQRRLAEEGADFSSLLNEVRREHAVRYLANRRVSLAEVAGLVGYNRETSFARWFAGEFGVTPSAWRASPR
jgi:AraC-like DNA-binding protein